MSLMKAARYYGPKDIRIEQIPIPVPKSGQVLIKVSIVVPFCGSDLHAYLATTPKWPTIDKPDPITGETLPTTLGHEFSGTIVELGPGIDANNWHVGQNVVVEPIYSCMKDTCRPCSSGSRNTCPLVNCYGIGGWGGGLSEYIAIDIKVVYKLPDGVPLEVGACVEPLSVAWHAVKRGGFTKGQTALILGAGPIGLFILKVLRAIDPTSTIIVSEPASIRREQALKHGATIAVNPKETSTRDTVLGATGDGVDVAFDAAGVQATIDAAVFSVRPKGKVVSVAIWETGHNASLNLSYIAVREIELIGVICYENDHPEVLAAIAAGKITNLEDLITRKIGLDDVVEKGFHTLINDKDSVVKIIVHP
ncbi:hypothetical protein AMATHDRAFT_75122 [Amanita thiersii Skay4041]|uniref:Enoyl reductase (ER) domain-containing protein n=1 Tax=Amanita thiersii Skay4041 TaxID=703135 RepID=A0A2A9NTP4_9AGAR|nr:hypothetical protein AMATHDRAFT_75122 [Amanita thiersii Skay4041]